MTKQEFRVYESLAAARQVLIRAENETWKDDPMGPAWILLVHAKFHLECQMLEELKGGTENGNQES